MRHVTLYHAEGCGLCRTALEEIEAARAVWPFLLELVDIGGDDALEAAYRIDLPVVEIDGIRSFVHEVDRDALLARLRARDGSPHARGRAPGTM
jgi:hypothetical protein